MRGYLSFILVLVSVSIILSLLMAEGELATLDFSKSIAVERMYQTELNIKQGVLEAARTGSRNAFFLYDETHDRENCKHCPDMGCIPWVPPEPPPPNHCDPVLCAMCFRDAEAMAAAAMGAQMSVSLLESATFGFEHEIWCGDTAGPSLRSLAKSMKNSGEVLSGGTGIGHCFAPVYAELTPDILEKNSVRLKSIRFIKDVGISLYSAQFGIASASYIPAGTEVET